MKDVTLAIGAGIVLLVMTFVLITLSPHTDPGVVLLEPGKARVHDGETIVFWVPSGKSAIKYNFRYRDNMVVASSLMYDDKRVILEGCETFRMAWLYTVEACRDGRDMIFNWHEFLLGVRIDR